MAGLAMALATTAAAQIPLGYYDALKGKKGAELKNAVHQTIQKAHVLSYGSGKGHTWDGFYTTDRTDDGTVRDRYSNDRREFEDKVSAVSGMNIEHSFPKSWWGGSKNQAYKDLYNLMPCEQKINSAKGNFPMGKVNNPKTNNGCTKVGTGSNGYTLWEPADKWKGDFARGYMYMATTYQNLNWKGDQAGQILQQGDYPTLRPWAYKLYLEWAREDKADDIETARNEAVSKIQGNRNPFVDFPNLMEYIWGDSVDYAFDPETTVKNTDYTPNGGTTPSEDETVYHALFTEATGGFTTDNGEIWKTNTKYGWTGKGFINNQKTEADASITSPEIDLTDYDEATLTFSHAVNFAASPADVLGVEVVSEGQTTRLTNIQWPAGNNWNFQTSGEIALGNFNGKKIRIVFHYTSSTEEASTWEIKEMTITAKRKANSIDHVTTTESDFNPDLPYETYHLDGSKADKQANGIIIIKQGTKVWKIAR